MLRAPTSRETRIFLLLASVFILLFVVFSYGLGIYSKTIKAPSGELTGATGPCYTTCGGIHRVPVNANGECLPLCKGCSKCVYLINNGCGCCCIIPVTATTTTTTTIRPTTTTLCKNQCDIACNNWWNQHYKEYPGGQYKGHVCYSGPCSDLEIPGVPDHVFSPGECANNWCKAVNAGDNCCCIIGQPYHWGCDNGNCVAVTGEGTNQCTSNPDCQSSVCNSMNGVYGCHFTMTPGAKQCSTKSDCFSNKCTDASGTGNFLCESVPSGANNKFDECNNAQDCYRTGARRCHGVFGGVACDVVEGSHGLDQCQTAENCR